jgi:hypothetical protein
MRVEGNRLPRFEKHLILGAKAAMSAMRDFFRLLRARYNPNPVMDIGGQLTMLDNNQRGCIAFGLRFRDFRWGLATGKNAYRPPSAARNLAPSMSKREDGLAELGGVAPGGNGQNLGASGILAIPQGMKAQKMQSAKFAYQFCFGFGNVQGG